jgi:hypothetical protein
VVIRFEYHFNLEFSKSSNNGSLSGNDLASSRLSPFAYIMHAFSDSSHASVFGAYASNRQCVSSAHAHPPLSVRTSARIVLRVSNTQNCI